MSNRPKSERLRLWMDSPKYSNNELTQDRSLRTIAGFAKKLRIKRSISKSDEI